EMGDAGDPKQINAVAVLRRVRTRHDEPGALVVLNDGRFAVSSNGVVATGSPQQLRLYAVRRIERSESRSERAWWQEVAGAVT
ncbi:MAG: potassium/proton antiporter, partial [Solirubrobacterales bacterium]